MAHARPSPFRVDDSATADISGEGSNIFFAAVETTRMPMLVTDPHQPDNPIIFANQAFLELTGYAADEVLGRNCRFLQGPRTDRAMVEQVREAIAARREIAVELVNYRKDGSAFWNALFVSPVLNKSGELTYFFASQLDVSRRRDAEEGLRQAQKMEAVGQLTGGIAHDFNNLLQVMLGHLDVVQRAAGAAEPDLARVARSTASARDAAERASALTQQLLAFSRKQQLQTQVLDLNRWLESARSAAARVLPGVQLRMDLTPQLWNCRIDPDQMQQALRHLLRNARDALRGRPHPSVSLHTRNVEVADAWAQRLQGLAPGRYVSLACTDNGVGMPAAVLEHALDPFFTTKDEGQGTGLGLSMVYGFVRQSGGTVRIYSEEGVGTTVRLYLPAADGASAPAAATAAEPAAAPRGRERILVVDDRQDVADLAQMMLEDHGYQAAVVYGPRDALAALEQQAFDLVFTDLIMPGGINGVVLAREVRSRWPRTRVLLTTGYAENAIQRTDADGAALDVISKPYLPGELARKVREVLDRPTGL